MTPINSFPVRILTRGARAIASYTAAEVLESHPTAGLGIGPDPLLVWQDWLEERINELATAMAVEHPSIFTRQVQWATALLIARGFADDHIRVSLEHLRRTIQSELPDTVHPLAAEYIDRALQSFLDPSGHVSPQLPADTPHGRLTTQYLLALFQGDRRRATRLIFGALDDGHSVEDLYQRVLLPSQTEVGRMWHADEINVAEEHFASATTKAVMAQLLSRAERRPNNGKTMLAAGVAGNHVDIGLQAVADFFETDGWRAIHLGANVPVRDIVQAVEYYEADLLGLSASQSTQLATLRQTIESVRMAGLAKPPKIMVGGYAFTAAAHLADQLNADGYASDPTEAVALGRRLVLGTGHHAGAAVAESAVAEVA